jgi:hypothetical protein
MTFLLIFYWFILVYIDFKRGVRILEEWKRLLSAINGLRKGLGEKSYFEFGY